jgi:SpoVK/Ycf46/Vps4 family AAA+-type ATPase
MTVPVKPSQKGKRHHLVGFLASCIPNIKFDADGAIGIELGVVNYLVEKLQKKIANKKEKEELEKLIKGLEVQTGGQKKAANKVEDQKNVIHKADDNKKEGSPQIDEQNAAAKIDKSKDAEKKDGKLVDNRKDDNLIDNKDQKAQSDSKTPEKENDEVAGAPKPETEHDKHSRAAHDKQLNASLDDTVQEFKPNTTWDMVAGLENAKLQLQLAAELPQKQPALFQGRRKAAQFVLLYGPPGTGKGHLAKALCNSVDSTFFMVSASDMTSKWTGDSER